MPRVCLIGAIPLCIVRGLCVEGWVRNFFYTKILLESLHRVSLYSESMIVVIPASKPDEKLIKLIKDLAKRGHRSIIIIDDGADAGFVRAIEGDQNAVLLRNKAGGRGGALKTAFAHIKNSGDCTADDCVVTLETNGRGAEDALATVEKLKLAHEAEPDALVIAEREFAGGFPIKSRLLRASTRLVYAMTTGVRLKDTLSGFRAFPVKLIDELLEIEGDGDEYEAKQLLRLAKQNIRIAQTETAAVYTRENWSGSAIRGVWSVCKTFFSFVGSSFMSWLIDYTLLLILHSVFTNATNGVGITLFGMTLEPKLPAIVIARTVGSTVNYILNSKVVFRSKSRFRLIKYIINTAVMLTLNYILLRIITAAGVPLAAAQILAQLVVYPLNFMSQRKFVFGSIRG